ncbi:acyltransferase [Colwellia demingiae]|uniref:Acyltransferase n=1 Tax=Colwellia demingiae TaxID=89401 RepID=A0A5C6QSR9_9GAMM|nr:acyltransferase [Colwellia demingiae]TWX71929.1 acyltransferase [Colwellia demingiae]
MNFDIYIKWKFDLSCDRLGPDMPFTHWRLYFKNKMFTLCKEKFKFFSNTSEFRAGAYAITCSKISIGENVIIRPNTMIFADPSTNEAGSVYIEKDVMIGSGVHIYVSNHRFDRKDLNLIDQGHSAPRSVTLKEGAWVGANAIILPGVVVGKNSVVAAGSIVTKDIPDRVVVAGNPAKIIKNLSK